MTETEEPTEPSAESDEAIDLSYDPMLVQTDGGAMDEIHSMAVTGRSSSAAMDTQAPNVGFETMPKSPWKRSSGRRRRSPWSSACPHSSPT